MLKKFFIIIVISGIAYVGYTFLPGDIRDKARQLTGSIGLSTLSPTNWLPPLMARAEPLKEKIVPQSPVKTREKLIASLSENLEVIANNPSPVTAKEKELVNAAVVDAQKIISELKEENGKSGVFATAVERVVNKVLPEEPAAVCRP
jgi:hypothetical protein